jgi:hypothetical protein
MQHVMDGPVNASFAFTNLANNADSVPKIKFKINFREFVLHHNCHAYIKTV